MKRLAAAILLTVILLLLFCGCSGGPEQPLRVGLMSDVNSIPYIVAKQQGYLDENVELVIFRSPTDRDSALFSGNLDGCSSDVLAVCLAQNGDIPLYITSVTDGNYGLAAGADSGITDAQGLAGREVALSLNTIIEYVADCILEDLGVDPASVIKSPVPQTPARLELLQAGQIDAIAVPEPYLSGAWMSGAAVIGTASELGIYPAIMCFTGDAVENRADELKLLGEAYDKALDFMGSTAISEYLPAVVDELGLPEITLDLDLPDYRKTSLPDEAQVLRAADWLFSKGLVDRLFTYEDLIWALR